MTRKKWIDSARGIGIFLVVFAHALRGLFNSGILPEAPLLLTTDKFIYAFHMPLFFILSGIFASGARPQAVLDFLRGRMGRLLYPYFLWATLSTLLMLLFGRMVNSPISYRTLLEIPYVPPAQFWFIYALFFISVGQYFAQRARIPAFAVLVLWIGFHYSGDWLSLPNWGTLYSIKGFGMYFGTGVVISNVVMGSKLDDVGGRPLGIVMVAGYATVLWGIMSGLDENARLSPLIALSGAVATISFSILVSRHVWGEFLQKWGVYSLEIYVGHTIFSAGFRIILQKLCHVELGALHLLLGTAIGILGPLTLAIYAKKRGAPYLFSLPRHRMA